MGTIAKITAGGTTHLVASSAYGTCSTGAGTAAKVVTMSNFDTLIAGMTIHVYFTYSNTAASPTLNVNSKGSKPIYKYGTTVPGTTAATSWQAGSIVSFTYNTTANSSGCWMMNDHLDDTDNNTTYSAGTGLSLSGTTFSNSGVTGVKGDSEDSYRTGDVNLTAANIGAAASSHTHSPEDLTSGYLNIHPENSPVLIPFMHNDIAHLLQRGGSVVYKENGTTVTKDVTNLFDASGSYLSYSATTLSSITEIIIELTLHKTFTYSNWIYIDFGNVGWRAKTVKIEVMNGTSTYPNDVWTQKYSTTTNALGHVAVAISHTPVGASNAGGGFNKLRFTLSNWNTTQFRISQIGIYNYGSFGLRETYMSRGVDDVVYRDISPDSTNVYSLGTSSHKWKNVYANTLNGTTIPSTPKFTDTTYAASTISIGSASTGTAIPADDITAWTTNTPTAVTPATVVTSASGATASVSNGVLSLTNGSFGTGPAATVTAGTAASLSYTAKSIPNISVTSKTVVTGITAN